MTFTTRIARTLAIGALTLSLGASLAAAQDALDPTAPANFGSATLNANFLPDPFIVTVQSGGNLEAASIDATCRGYVTAAPDYSLTYNGSASNLRFYFAGAGDATMIVRGPNEALTCNDDGFGFNPLVQIVGPTAGEYNVWVGSYSSGEFIPGYLMITELAGTTEAPIQSALLAEAVGAEVLEPQAMDSGLDPSREATFGTVTLEPGFLPDPHTVQLLSGGSVNVGMLSLGAGCIGYAAVAPDYSINLSGDTSRLRFAFLANDNADTTLIIGLPNGGYVCNDDADGRNPVVELTAVPAGQYDIWVGTYGTGDLNSGTLSISETGGAPANNVAPTAVPANNGMQNVTGATSVPPVQTTPEASSK